MAYDGGHYRQNPLQNLRFKVLRSFHVRKIFQTKGFERSHTQVLQVKNLHAWGIFRRQNLSGSCPVRLTFYRAYHNPLFKIFCKEGEYAHHRQDTHDDRSKGDYFRRHILRHRFGQGYAACVNVGSVDNAKQIVLQGH